MQCEGSVDAPLSNRIATQFAILGIAPGALGSFEIFFARRPTCNPDGRLLTTADLTVHEEVGLRFVRHQCLLLWGVEDSIALGITRNMPVIVEKEAHLAWMVSFIRYHYMTHKNIVMEIHEVSEDQPQL